MRPAVILAVILAALLGAAAGPEPAKTPWQVEILQLDQNGTLVGQPQEMTCSRGGCQTMVSLEISGVPQRFLAVLTFVPRGAYLALQAQTPELGSTIEYEKGFQGPVFLPFHNGQAQQTLRFTLTGAALDGPDNKGPKLMQNDRSLVFHRKLNPDFIVRIQLSPSKINRLKE